MPVLGPMRQADWAATETYDLAPSRQSYTRSRIS